MDRTLLSLAAVSPIAQPLSVAVQLAVGSVGLLILMLIRAFQLGSYWKQLFYAIGDLLVLRYVYWLTTSTLPSPQEMENFIPGLIVCVTEMYCVAFLAIV